MPAQQCTNTEQHGEHEWYWRRMFRRECRGLGLEFCGLQATHSPHLRVDRDELCNGLGLAGRCEHGVQMLDECEDCTAKEEANA